METKSLNFEGRELPPYLGFGILDEKSVVVENDTIRADYHLECDGSVVHKIKWDMSHCELKTELHGTFCGTSWYPDLKKAMLYDFMGRDLSKDKVFGFLMKKTCDTGNIHVQNPDKKDSGPKTFYFPAVRLMSFRLPLPEKTQLYRAFLDFIRSDEHISLFQEQNAYLLMADTNMNVTMQPITIAEFTVPIAYMTQAARVFSQSGLIHPSKILRLMVDDSVKTGNSFLQTFIGTSVHPYFAYCFRELEKEKQPAVIKLFTESVKGLNLCLEK